MATLDVEVQNGRYSVEKLVQLTNPDNPTATSISTVNLNSAVADVVADFDIFANTTFSPTDTRHVALGCEGVILKLQMRQLNIDPSELRKEWIGLLWTFAQGPGSRTKITPQTTSILTPSSELPDNSTQPVRPLFDPTKFDKFAPQSPPGAPNPTSFPTDR